MSGSHLWLTEAQFTRLQPLLPNKPRGDDRRVISGTLHVLRNGLMWRDAPACYGLYKTLYNRFVRWLPDQEGGSAYPTWQEVLQWKHTNALHTMPKGLR